MASARNIRAPGIELREIDRSSYSTQDNSLPNAPTVLIPGFADYGENCTLKWINTTQTLLNTYGYPQSEFEQLFHNACIDIINRGGVCLAAKLPYVNNESKGYTFCDYSVSAQPVDISESEISSLNVLDSDITSFVKIYSADCSGKMSLSKFDDLKIGNLGSSMRNTIRVVDISKGRYTKSCFNALLSSSEILEKECLGIFPVIVTPPNALYWQQIKNTIDARLTSVCLSDYDPMSELSVVEPNRCLRGSSDATFDDIDIEINLSDLASNSVLQLTSTSNLDETVSKNACSQFPQIVFRDSQHFDSKYMKQIGIVVIKAYADESVSNKVNFKIVEAFVGSLDKTARSTTGGSLFIDNVVNNQSEYINVFSNIDKEVISKSSTLFIHRQKSTMLGFYPEDCKKVIDPTQSILNPLTQIFDTIRDPNQYPLDLIVDAGTSNIAQYIKSKGTSSNFTWKLGSTSEEIKDQTKVWSQVLKKFDDFCKFTRKDCMFIADGLRPFCLEGNEKIVRKTKIGCSVTKDILPRLRYISGLNSSYSAGYCNWFQSRDYYTNDLFWCPPSIKAASVYIYCDTYFHTWDAPAGFTRGVIPSTVDTAFSPTEDEAGKLYDQSWNYAINYPIEGIILEGQKTFQTNKTALDRVNVRRLLLSLEKKVVQASKYFIYEGNTEYLRQKFVDAIRPIFEDAVNGNGISEYAIKCDDDLNTTQVIENNEMRCRIAIKPIKTIEFIVLDFICTSQSASVTEEVAS